MNYIMYGVSYGAAICEFQNILEVEKMNVDLLEIPLDEYDEMSKIIRFCKMKNYKYSIHIPSNYLIKKQAFILNFRTTKQVDSYIKLVNKTLIKFSDIEYLVAHFPLHSKLKDSNKYTTLNKYYVEQIMKFAEEKRIKLLFENVGIRNEFYMPEQYHQILKSARVCYDIGHAYTMNTLLGIENERNLVKDFFIEFKINIEAIHLYNCNLDNYKTHSPFINDEKYLSSNYMEYSDVKNNILALPNLQYIIFEPHRKEYLKNKKIGDVII